MAQPPPPPSVPRLALPLESQRLHLRDYQADDAAKVHAMLQEPDYWRHQAGDQPDLKRVEALMAWAGQEQSMEPRLNYYLAAILKDTGEIVGEGVIKVLDPVHRQGELGFGVAKPHWNKGLATEISKTLLTVAFSTLNLHRVQALASPDNKGAIRVMQKLGMGREGLLRDVAQVKGRWWSSVVYSVLDREFETVTKNQGG